MPTLIARLRPLVLGITLIALGPPEYGAAQAGLASLAPGAHVRVTATSLGPTARTARVVTASADTLVVRPDDAHGFDVTLPRAEITQLDLSVGRRTRKTRLALVGSGVGMVVGLIAGAVSYSDPCETNPAVCAGWFYETRGGDMFGGAVAGALLGAVAGAIAGQVWATEQWMPHPLGTHGAALRVLPERSRRPSVELVLTMAVQ
jgi:hypothetical protein